LDPAYWSYDLGTGHNGWGNGEAQIYRDSSENCRIEDGALRIRATKEDGNYYSARIHTAGKISWTYGRIEAVAKLPQGRGSWPAVWMLGDDFHRGIGWPRCGEIDIVEHVGRDPGRVHFSLHSQSHNHRKKNQVTGSYSLPEVLDGFHEYRIDWDEDGFRFAVDGKYLGDFPRAGKSGQDDWPFDKPHFLIMNYAVGGGWGGEVDPSIFPSELAIERVTVYQKETGR